MTCPVEGESGWATVTERACCQLKSDRRALTMYRDMSISRLLIYCVTTVKATSAIETGAPIERKYGSLVTELRTGAFGRVVSTAGGDGLPVPAPVPPPPTGPPPLEAREIQRSLWSARSVKRSFSVRATPTPYGSVPERVIWYTRMDAFWAPEVASLMALMKSPGR